MKNVTAAAGRKIHSRVRRKIKPSISGHAKPSRTAWRIRLHKPADRGEREQDAAAYLGVRPCIVAQHAKQSNRAQNQHPRAEPVQVGELNVSFAGPFGIKIPRPHRSYTGDTHPSLLAQIERWAQVGVLNPGIASDGTLNVRAQG